MRTLNTALMYGSLLVLAQPGWAQQPTADNTEQGSEGSSGPMQADAASGAAPTKPATDADALAKQLANPVAALISVPFQFNYDRTFGDKGERVTLNIQPVIPFRISEDWNLISRTILPVIDQHDVIPGTHQRGLGDTSQTLFFSPAKPSDSGVVWGVGPVFLLPTGNNGLGGKTWAAGGSALVLRQRNGWTVGGLVSHVVDVAGGRNRADISSTFAQPFINKALGGGRTWALNAEANYDWNRHAWNVPVNMMLAKVTMIGQQRVSIQGGVRMHAKTPAGGPDWGLRFTATFLFPQ